MPINKLMLSIYGKKHPEDAPNFTYDEWKCNDGTNYILNDPENPRIAQLVRDHFGVPVTLTSGFRSKSYNAKIGGSSSSQHCLGTAADIKVSGVDPIAVAIFLSSLPEFATKGGIGCYSHDSNIGGFTHFDTRATK